VSVRGIGAVVVVVVADVGMVVVVGRLREPVEVVLDNKSIQLGRKYIKYKHDVRSASAASSTNCLSYSASPSAPRTHKPS
jgi:hypothetical protein